jgi:hypothetical protein
MSNIDFPLAATNGQLFTASNGASYVYLTPPGLWRVSTSPSTAPYPPTGPASGDLVGSYPSPTIKPSVVLKGNPTLESVVPAADNDQSIATTAFVQSAIGLIPPPGGTTVGSTPPIIATPGQLWFNSDQGSLYVFYADPDSQQWVPATPSAVAPSGRVLASAFGCSPTASGATNIAAIQAALNVGGEIELPPGVIPLDNVRLVPKSNTTIYGNGNATILTRQGNTPLSYWVPFFYLLDVHNVTFDGVGMNHVTTTSREYAINTQSSTSAGLCNRLRSGTRSEC